MRNTIYSKRNRTTRIINLVHPLVEIDNSNLGLGKSERHQYPTNIIVLASLRSIQFNDARDALIRIVLDSRLLQ